MKRLVSCSRYMAEYPVVPLEKIQVQLNMDMIGRTRMTSRILRTPCSSSAPIESAPTCTTWSY